MDRVIRQVAGAPLQHLSHGVVLSSGDAVGFSSYAPPRRRGVFIYCLRDLETISAVPISDRIPSSRFFLGDLINHPKLPQMFDGSWIFYFSRR